MRARRIPLTVALLPILLAIGCGSGGTTVGGGNEPAATGATPAGARPAAFDPRDAPLGCLHAKGIESQKDAKQTDRLVILPTTSGAYVEFAATPAEAQGRQIRNQAPGAEVIGPHLLTVGHLSDDELRAIETCLQAQGSRY
ncbi:MAG TPA: hypothetical protein VFF79_11965 [Conexibacter sp.]|jgi:hypothetical protein|nr:hypothetical protein [Conexibacter sp.]